MRFSHVAAFRAVMLSGSMTMAAHELNTSQPNVSRLITQLEKDTGLKLFSRMAGRLQATPEAHAFYRDVERAYVGLADLEQSAQTIRKLGTGHLRVGAVPSMGLTVLPGIMRDFAAVHPAVRISVHFGDSVTVAQWTASRFCDIGITSYISDAIGVEADLALKMDGVCIVPPKHRLARRRTPLQPKDLAGEPFISLSHGDRRHIDSVFTRGGEDKRDLAHECQYAAVICSMVGNGMGLSIVNPIVADFYKHTGISVHEFEPSIQFMSYILTPLRYAKSELTSEFSAMIKNHISDALGLI
ncbi:transcriptional regulator [Azorhizobium caulinodans ORS 571]|uniref:Transcriptional regulator n=1 Tax=Azorhizobium caulinodans (strain ATCC 43989 / DSM 5975 / JCM 20966 / LMG 6465 / NBRC 14845 / NCIMB 13405 / ORS 571) TaxID=438753 RepID=A8IK73_AZOC5|nr:LysR substrate-binding domain-containing protein [Azorhizobium caulinodans]BAF89867.1 transcriptional regulator [Azorhizobium caulinodans ORS 571]